MFIVVFCSLAHVKIKKHTEHLVKLEKAEQQRQ